MVPAATLVARSLACAALAFGALSSANIASAAPAAATHAAACVAALKAKETTLAETVKAGGTGAQPELLVVVRSGIAIIGTQYLAGMREAEARELLKAAEDEFQTLPPNEATERQAECLREGSQLFDRASPLERSLISSAAERRVRRLTKTS